MSKKICSKCQEVNSSSAMICSYCNSTLVDSKVVQEEKYEGYHGAGRYTGGTDEISIGTWIGIFLVLAIPLVNIIALFFFAYGNNSETLKNFAKAQLILVGIGLVLLILIRGCAGMI